MQTLYYDAPSNTSRRSSSYGSTTYNYDCTEPIVMMRMRDPKICANISQNLLYCSLGYIYKHIGTPNARKKVLWVYSHLKSGFLFLQKVT